MSSERERLESVILKLDGLRRAANCAAGRPYCDSVDRIRNSASAYTYAQAVSALSRGDCDSPIGVVSALYDRMYVQIGRGSARSHPDCLAYIGDLYKRSACATVVALLVSAFPELER